jgi:hypothetical protein
MPQALDNRLSEEALRSLTLGRSGGTAGAEIGTQEAVSEHASLSAESRHGGAFDDVDASGDDELLQALLMPVSDLQRTAEDELLSGFDIAASLLTGVRPKADILPQKGSHMASVATLLHGDSDGPAAQSGVEVQDDVPLPTFLIDPVRKPTPRPPAVHAPAAEAGEAPLWPGLVIGPSCVPLFFAGNRPRRSKRGRTPGSMKVIW